MSVMSSPLCKRKEGGLCRPPPPKQTSPRTADQPTLAASGDLVERRVGYLEATDPRRSLEHLRQTLQHFRIRLAFIGFRVLFAVPQADGKGFLAVLCDERDLVREAGALPKQGQDVLLERLRELTRRVGLQMHRNVACVHYCDSLATTMNLGNRLALLGLAQRTVLQ